MSDIADSTLQRLPIPAELLAQLCAETLSRGQSLTLELSSGSMWPFLQKGAHVVIAPLGAPAGIGDVVVFPVKEHLICHRVVGIRQSGRGLRHLITKGDSARVADPPNREEALVGRVVAAQLDGRWRNMRTFGWRSAFYIMAHLSRYTELLRHLPGALRLVNMALLRRQRSRPEPPCPQNPASHL